MTRSSRTWSGGRRVALVIAAVGLLVVAGVAPVAAGGGSAPTRTLRTVDKGVAVGDIATRGSYVAVAWSEYAILEPAGVTIADRVFYRLSADGGASFAARQRVDVRPNAWPAIDICRGSLAIVSEVHYGEDPDDQWDIILHQRSLEGPGAVAFGVTNPLVDLEASSPDVACVGDRFLAVTWRERIEGGEWRAKLRLMDSFPDTAGGPPAIIDLGPAHGQAEVSVAATPDTIVTAWRQGGALRFKRFDVSPSAVAASLQVTRTLFSSATNGPVEVGLSGDRIVVAAMRSRDLIVRRSTDNGVSFGAPRTLLRGDATCCFIAIPTSVDVRGARVLLEGARAYGDFGGGVFLQRRFVSTDGGATWSVTRLGSEGARVGAWSTASGSPRIAEAWDDRWAPAPHHIWFRRQL